jgi:hypothetical protein
MPGLPLLLGLGNWMGVRGSHGIRVFGMLALAAWVILLVCWMGRRGLARRYVWLVALGACFSPVVRWGAMVVRPEVWQGLLWLLMLIELDRRAPSRWRLAALLALAAYFHFQAVVWVFPVALGLFPFDGTGGRRARLKRWRQALFSVAWRVILLLSPWLVYVLGQREAFWAQMQVQFARLSGGHPYIPSIAGFLHSLFPELGNPLPNPRFLDVGKGFFWLLLLAGMGKNLYRAAQRETDARVRLAASAAVAATLYLWVTKPEIWFTTLIHMSFWPLLALAVPARKTIPGKPHTLLRVAGGLALTVLLVVEAGVAFEQWRAARPHYLWPAYRQWVSCINRAIGARACVWQPHWPDVLVELASREPGREYFRAVDFETAAARLEKHAHGCGVVVHSLYLPVGERPGAPSYQGQPREVDVRYLAERVPFPEFSAPALGAEWRLEICQQGPFWASVSVRGE